MAIFYRISKTLPKPNKFLYFPSITTTIDGVIATGSVSSMVIFTYEPFRLISHSETEIFQKSKPFSI